MIKRDVFIRKSKTKASGTVKDMLRVKPAKGDIGIEIEVEGNKFPQGASSPCGEKDSHLIPKQWAYHHDGSLRGAQNAEYVLKSPLKFGNVPKAVDDLWQMFEDYGSKLDVSNRTSVHVHLNAQSFYLDRLCSFFALYFSVEEILTGWCGENRVGNLFCLQAKDAHSIISVVKDFLQSNGVHLIPKNYHYSGLNIHALQKHGSLEIRSLRGATEKDVILQWVSVLEHIYKLSDTFKDPRDICSNYSGFGYEHFLKMVLGENFEAIVSDCGMTYQQIASAALNGVRLAQDLCYCRDWSEYERLDTKNKGPFSRNTRLVQPYMNLESTEGGSVHPAWPNAMGSTHSEQQLADMLNELEEVYDID